MNRLAVFSVCAACGLGAVAAPTPVLSAPPDAHCTCRNRDGTRHEIGETVCIRVGADAYLARCEKDLNVTTWRRLQDGCPTAALIRRKPPLAD